MVNDFSVVHPLAEENVIEELVSEPRSSVEFAEIRRFPTVAFIPEQAILSVELPVRLIFPEARAFACARVRVPERMVTPPVKEFAAERVTVPDPVRTSPVVPVEGLGMDPANSRGE